MKNEPKYPFSTAGTSIPCPTSDTQKQLSIKARLNLIEQQTNQNTQTITELLKRIIRLEDIIGL